MCPHFARRTIAGSACGMGGGRSLPFVQSDDGRHTIRMYPCRSGACRDMIQWLETMQIRGADGKSTQRAHTCGSEIGQPAGEHLPRSVEAGVRNGSWSPECSGARREREDAARMQSEDNPIYRDVPIPDRNRESLRQRYPEGDSGRQIRPVREHAAQSSRQIWGGKDEELRRMILADRAPELQRRLQEHGKQERSYLETVNVCRRRMREILSPDRKESAEDGFQVLKSMGDTDSGWNGESVFDPDSIRTALQYYVITADLPRSYVAEVFEKEIAEDERILALMLYQEAETDQLYESISEFGRYRGSKSAFFRAHEEDMKAVLVRVYRTWADMYQSEHGRALADELAGKSDTRPWLLSRVRSGENVAADRKKDRIFLVDPLLVYWCRRGNWTITQYFPRLFGSRLLQKTLGEVCRETERQMRAAVRYRNLKPGTLDEKLRKLVERTVQEYLRDRAEEQAKAARQEIRLDLGKLSAIRSDADYTRDQLLDGIEDETDLAAAFPSPRPRQAESVQTPARQPGSADAVPAQASQAHQPAGNTAGSAQTSARQPGSADAVPAQASQAHQPADNTADEATRPSEPVVAAPQQCRVPEQAAFGLSAEETDILHILLAGENPASYIRAHHLYPAVVADSAVMEEDGTLSLIEDYLDDLRFLLPQ